MKKKPTPVCQTVELDNCFSCKVVAGKPHKKKCDIERCSECGGQKLGCDCENHDKHFARWTREASDAWTRGRAPAWTQAGCVRASDICCNVRH